MLNSCIDKYACEVHKWYHSRAARNSRRISARSNQRAKVLAKRQCKLPAIAKAPGGHSCKAIRVWGWKTRRAQGMEKHPLYSESYYRAVYVIYPCTLRKLFVTAACACTCHLDYIQGSGT